MHFGKTNTKYKYKIDDEILEEVSVEKYLGVYISNIWIAVTISTIQSIKLTSN
jgi:hypothetical protein